MSGNRSARGFTFTRKARNSSAVSAPAQDDRAWLWLAAGCPLVAGATWLAITVLRWVGQ